MQNATTETPILYRDSQGTCHRALVLIKNGAPVDIYGTPYVPTGETAQLKGWGSLDGPATEWVKDHDAPTAILVPIAAQ